MNSTNLMSVVVLISGSGSNLQAIIDGMQSGQLPIQISAVISNKADVKGLERAANASIPTHVINHKEFSSREAFDRELMATIDQHKPQLVVLAGFMRILTEEFTNHYLGRMINIHPSLLPKYQGLHTHQRAIDAGDSHHGASVHFVTAELDGGPVIVQAKVAIDDQETADTLAAKVLKFEHQIFPQTVQWFAEHRLTMEGNQALLDGKPLDKTGFQWN
ncbi:phosphoribosylglycinamide formyltransferase [Sessilibacter corallicola]|uniref:Phosphoribosylglycinamide formyltransferase n=1 Tax=Sessilibacter corallicola TaxID=2904075 RepID=A0ABQ0A4F3_9GAMM